MIKVYFFLIFAANSWGKINTGKTIDVSVITGKEARELFYLMRDDYKVEKDKGYREVFRVIRAPDGLSQKICEGRFPIDGQKIKESFECKIETSLDGKVLPKLVDRPYAG